MRVEDQRCQIQLFRDAKLTPAAAKSKIHLWPFLPLANFSSLFPPQPNWTKTTFLRQTAQYCIILPPLPVADVQIG